MVPAAWDTPKEAAPAGVGWRDPTTGVDVTSPVAALVRAVPDTLAAAELTHLERVPVDVARARTEHDGYCRLLEQLGLSLVWAPSTHDLPDSTFVEDAVVVIDDHAILTRPGAASRRAEPATLRPVLEARGLVVDALASPATLDGGDVLQVGDDLFVGRTERTNDAGIRQLATLAARHARRVVPVTVEGVLHLKTAATALPDGTIIRLAGAVERSAFAGRLVVDAAEPSGGDVLLVGDHVILPASAPDTAALVAARGWPVHTLELAELQKAESGPTCLSVLLP